MMEGMIVRVDLKHILVRWLEKQLDIEERCLKNHLAQVGGQVGHSH